MTKLHKILNEIKYFLRIMKLNNRLKLKNLFKFREEEIFAAFIDLNAFAPNFNYVEYLLYVRYLAKDKNLFLIVLPKEEFSNTNTKEKKEYFYELRVKTILKPLIELIISNHGTVIYANKREDMRYFFELPETNKFPSNISVNEICFTAIDSKKLYESFKEKNQKFILNVNENLKLFIKDNYLKNLDKKIITISLKYNSYRPHMNSNINEWKLFGEWLEEKNYKVIFISDIENLGDVIKLNKPEFYTLASISSFDMEIRKSLFDLSNLNFSTNGGAAQLLFNSNNNYIVTKFVSIKDKNALGTGSIKDIENQLGFIENQQYPFSLKTQKILGSRL